MSNKRTTTPDRFSLSVKRSYTDLRAGRITPAQFSDFVSAIWHLRRATPREFGMRVAMLRGGR